MKLTKAVNLTAFICCLLFISIHSTYCTTGWLLSLKKRSQANSEIKNVPVRSWPTCIALVILTSHSLFLDSSIICSAVSILSDHWRDIKRKELIDNWCSTLTKSVYELGKHPGMHILCDNEASHRQIDGCDDAFLWRGPRSWPSIHYSKFITTAES